jgi:membrane fusion protein (multidrug efflux system)
MSDLVLERDTSVAPVRRRARLSPKRLAIVAFVAAAGAAGAWQGHGWWTTGRFFETTDDAYVGGDVTPIAPHVAGFVEAILVGDNDHVRAGQVLVRLDRRDAAAALDKARAVVEARVAAVANLHAQVTLQQSTIAQAEADLEARTARAAFAHIDHERYAALAGSNYGSRQDAQRAEAANAEAHAALVAATAALAAARQQLKVLDTRVSEAEAEIAQARADRAKASLEMDYTEVHAPVDGYVANRAARVGAYVSPGAYLISVVPDGGLWIDANFKEDQLARIAPGQPATITTDIAPGVILHGQVASLAHGTGAVFSVIPPENATGNFTKIVQRVPVRITLDASEAETLGRLRPGLSTLASVDTRTRR